MPWEEITVMSQRQEFCTFANQSCLSMSELCRRFGISRKTGYKWLDRFNESGVMGLADLSRRPHHSPNQTDPVIESEVLELQDKHKAWGGRKLRASLIAQGFEGVPAASTITDILRRHDLLDPSESAKHTAWQRFEHAEPNSLWQMDFKGHFSMERGRCHPLTTIDDHARFAIQLKACEDESGKTVQEHLISTFELYGLPRRMLFDNGGPWSGAHGSPHSWLTVWLMRLGISISHGRSYHPQTQGKVERFHRTLKTEVLLYNHFVDLNDTQSHFDRWRDEYNCERPHESLGMATPASRYIPSKIPYPAVLDTIEYPPGDAVRKVQDDGCISFHGRPFLIGKAFHKYPVGIRPTLEDGTYDVFFCHQKVAEIDLTIPYRET